VEKTIYFPPYRQFLAWLKGERGKRRLTMRKVAGAIQVPSSWVSKIEHGDRRLDVAEYVRYCIALKIDPHKGIARLERDTREWLRKNRPDKS